MFDRMKTKEIT